MYSYGLKQNVNPYEPNKDIFSQRLHIVWCGLLPQLKEISQ